MGLADLTIGRYYPAESVIHQLDARIKILSTVILTASVFLTDSFYALFFAAIFIAMVFFFSKLPVSWIYKAVKPVFYLLIIAFIVQAFFTPGVIIARAGFIKITDRGLLLGSFIVLRVLIVVSLGSILMFTTQPITIADGLESLFKPLRLFKLPVHEISLTITLALRFIPELLSEAQKIAFAQTSRGADFVSRNIYRRIKSLISLFVPLLVSSLMKAEDLGKAMEARSYSGSEGRTKYYQKFLTVTDYVSMLVVIAVSILTYLIR